MPANPVATSIAFTPILGVRRGHHIDFEKLAVRRWRPHRPPPVAHATSRTARRRSVGPSDRRDRTGAGPTHSRISDSRATSVRYFASGRVPAPECQHRLNVDPFGTGRILTPLGGWVGESFGVVDGHPPKVAVFESVAVAFEGDDFGVVDEAVDHGSGDDWVAEGFTSATWNWHTFDSGKPGISWRGGGPELDPRVRTAHSCRHTGDPPGRRGAMCKHARLWRTSP